MRLFVALQLPEEVRADLAAALERVRPTAPGRLRWAAPDRWHLTLAFLGGVPDERVSRVAAALGRKVARHGPLRLGLAGAGRFGRNVLWIGVDGDTEPLRRLADAVAAGARHAHVPIEERPYRAHLTVARAAGSADLRPLVEALQTYRGPAWQASEVHLVQSRLGAHPSYDTVTAWPLTASSSS